MRFGISFLFFMLVVSLTGGAASAQNAGPDCMTPFFSAKKRKTIKVGAYIYPPASYVDESGVFTGKTVEIMRSVLQLMGYESQFVIMPFKRTLESMKDGIMPIMLPCVVNDERLVYMDFTKPVYYIDSVLWRQGVDKDKCWNNYGDLKRKRIGATNGYAYGPEWDTAVSSGVFIVDKVASKNPEIRHFEMVLEGRTDMFICERSLGEYIKERYAPRYDDVYPCPKSVGPVRSFNASVSKKFFVDNKWDIDDFLARFNHALEHVLASAD